MYMKLHHNLTIRSEKVKLAKTGRKIEQNLVKLAIFPLCAAPDSLCAAPVWTNFWGSSWCPNQIQVGLLEMPTCLLSNASGSFQFSLHFPYQKSNLPRLLPMCQNRGSEVIF